MKILSDSADIFLGIGTDFDNMPPLELLILEML
jgi:hypothetical protein